MRSDAGMFGMDPSAIVGIAVLSALLLVLVRTCRTAPRCPRCGSIFGKDVGAGLLSVRMCSDCFEIYEVRPR